jgi:cysteine desulfurase family protein (TIGR01976 family)
VKWLDFSTETYEYNLSQLDNLLTARTKLVAVNYASNVIGTINDVRTISTRAKAVGSLVFVDAVQYAPHGVIDVQDIGCDFLVCSAYKFYGPHYGILWGKLDVLESLRPYKVRTAPDTAPDKFETGTKSREAIAGVLGAIEHFAWLGGEQGTRRERIVAGMSAVRDYEHELTLHLLNRLQEIDAVTVHGKREGRVPTLALTISGRTPAEVAKALGAHKINVWHGHNYGWEPVKRLGLLETGGILRVSLAQYNTLEEIDYFLEKLVAVRL